MPFPAPFDIPAAGLFEDRPVAGAPAAPPPRYRFVIILFPFFPDLSSRLLPKTVYI